MGNPIKINFGAIPSNTVPEGLYDAEVTKVELKDSNSSDSQYFNWEFTITADEEGDATYEGKKVWMMTSLSDAALWKLKDVLTAFGEDTDGEIDIDVDDDNLLVYPDVVGSSVQIVIEHRKYQGKERAQVRDIMQVYALPGGAAPALESGEEDVDPITETPAGELPSDVTDEDIESLFDDEADADAE